MLDSPAAPLLLAEVEAAIRRGLPPGFEARVAANAVALARREAERAASAHEAERVRLAALLGVSGALVDLNRALAAAIRGRTMAITPALLDHLRLTTREKMLVDQPNYPAFRAKEEQPA